MKTHQSIVLVDVPITVDWTFSPGCRGARDSLGGIRGAGPPLEPDEPPEIEIVSTKLGSTEVELSDTDRETIEHELWNEIAAMQQDNEPPEPPDFER